jgi:hypothetical protein
MQLCVFSFSEITELTHKMWVRFRFFWTRRREDEGLPAPALPAIIDSPSAEAGLHDQVTGRPRYPAIEFYRTRDETVAKMEDRIQYWGILPESVVEKAWLKTQNLADEQQPSNQSKQ